MAHSIDAQVNTDPFPAPDVPWTQSILMAPLAVMLRLMASLPAPIRRGAADLLALFAHKVVRYRRRIVRQNIADSYPQLDYDRRLRIEKDFYRNLADYFFQTVRLAYASKADVDRHVIFEGLDDMAASIDRGHDIVLYTSHFGNWEYIPSLAYHMPPGHEDVIYAHVNRPLKNLWFNRFFHRLRSRFNVSIPMKQTARAMIGWRREGRHFIVGFLSDQKPGRYTRSETVDFLGRPTPFIAGTEDLARKLNCAVFYTDVVKLKRDRFLVRMVKMTENAASAPQGVLTAEYAAMLSQSINRNPASYLWSHNKWRLPKK